MSHSVQIFENPYPAVLFIEDEGVLVDVRVPVEAYVEVSESGLQGPPGTSGEGATRYVHTQASPSTLWTVNHNLGYTPASVRVLSVGGLEMIAEVVEVSVNQLQVSLEEALTGTVVIV